jgi:hypothetical protein
MSSAIDVFCPAFMLFITTVPQIMPNDFGLARYHNATELRQADTPECGTRMTGN